MARRTRLVTSYGDDLKLFRSRGSKIALAVLVLLFLAIPQNVSDFWLDVLNFAAIFAIGAIGLNLLTGYTGQVSLGHAFFLGVGAYVAAYAGGPDRWDLPFVVWLPLAAVVGGVAGALIGPFALRLRGNYLAIVSLGLLFVGGHLFFNWESVTGGQNGTPVPTATVGGADFGKLDLFGQTLTRQQGHFYLLWILVAVAALIAKNVVRTRPGRAMQAVRDRDLAAEVVGVGLARTKIASFALSSAFAAVAGALYGEYLQFVNADLWAPPGGLLLSIQFVAIIIVGGVGTIYGSIIGAIAVGGAPRIIERYSSSIPFIAKSSTGSGLTLAQANQLLFGLLIVFFLVVEPHGLAGLWRRIKAYFAAWPFSY